ncbi:MAG TPA: PEP-CTERM sorting domain-containing protein [Candidatus Binatia bacterium]|nr:PEP-CTERM sorting domain-containing protein [Candidatus Binatia bacterium]
MMRKRIPPICALMGSLMAVLFLFAPPVQALTMWTNWTSFTAGTLGGGSATGSVGGVGVSYSGELNNAVINGSSLSWAPNSSFTGGTVTVSPSVVGDDLRLDGSFTGTNTITFASTVENPVFAIWSLGSPSIPASFNFNATPTLEAGGPNSQFGGSSITVLGNVVSGREGNGVVQFTGNFTSISWTDTPEFFYAFTVGINGPLGPGPTPVPEPTSLILVGLGLVGLVSRLGKRQ